MTTTNPTTIPALPTGQRVPKPLTSKQRRKLREAEGGFATATDLLRFAAEVNGRRLSPHRR